MALDLPRESDTDSALTAAAPLAIACFRGRSTVSVLVSKQECLILQACRVGPLAADCTAVATHRLGACVEARVPHPAGAPGLVSYLAADCSAIRHADEAYVAVLHKHLLVVVPPMYSIPSVAQDLFAELA